MSAAPKNTSILRRMVPGLLLGFFVLLGLALFGDLQQVSRDMLHFRWGLFPFVLLFTLFNYILRFFKWDFYIHQMGVKNLSKLESLRLFVAGFPLAVTPGKVGEVFKAVWLNQASGLPTARGVSVVLAERISDGLAVLLLSVSGVIAFPKYWPAFALILAFLVGIVTLTQIRPLALKILSISENIRLVSRFAHNLREFYEGSFALFRPGPTLLAVGLGTISWLGEGIGFYLILIGLGQPPSWDLASTAVFILSFSTVVGAVSTLPGGLGAAEASIAGMLGLLAGLNGASASAATLLVRLATLWFGVSLGLIVWLFSPVLFGIKVEDGIVSPG